MTITRSQLIALCSAGASLLTGCASGPYQFGRGWHNAQSAMCAPPVTGSTPEVVEGRPNKFVDGLGWVVGIPGKLLLWDRRVNNHHVTESTTAAVAEYAERNQLQDVCVRVNQYDPGDEWRRLRENREVGPGWRYTVGVVSVLGYTLVPGRVFGGDRYNPYTNSIYVYSDVPSLGMYAAAYAKDVHHRDLPGTYAAVNELPLLSMWHETIATKDALAYLETTASADAQREGNRILQPNYGARVGGSVESVIGGGSVLQIGGALIGHVTGRMHRPRENDAHADRVRVTMGEDAEAGTTIQRVSFESENAGVEEAE